MENYYSFTQKVLRTLGIEIRDNVKETRSLFILKVFSLSVMFCCVVQSYLYFIYDDSFDYMNISSMTMGLFAIQGFAKHLYIVMNRNKMKIIMKELAELQSKADSTSLKFLTKIRKICVNIFCLNLACIWIFNLLPFAKMLYQIWRGESIEKILPYAFWWPFDPYDHYFVMLSHQIYCGHMLMAVPLIMDQIIFLVIAEIISLFRQLGEEFRTAIDNSMESSLRETNEKLKKCIDIHCKLIEICDSLNSIYSVPLLVQILAASGVICLIGFIIMVFKIK